MSFGALSEEAVRALSSGAKLADIAMGTGEGGLTPYHTDGVVKRVTLRAKVDYYLSLTKHYGLKFGFGTRPQKPQGEVVGGAKLIVEIGPAKFGFRRLITDPFSSAQGREFRKVWSNEFDWKRFAEVMANDQNVACEVKGGQGAKPGQGGKLPKEKITKEISEIRGVAMGEDCYSPNAWDEFDTVEGLVAFIAKLQEVSGKPVGYKTPVGTEKFIKQLANHMKESGKGPDFITIDGGEGGTGAAPVVLADSVGLPLFHAIPLVDNALREAGVRDRVVLIGSGQLAKGNDIIIAIALGVDMVHIARAFLIGGLGCIMALRCQTNRCPTGIATQDARLRRGLDPDDKHQRVYNYASVLQREILMICKAMGVRNPWELTREHVSVVSAPMVSTKLSDIHPYPAGDDGKRHLPLAPALEVAHTDAHDDRGPKLIKLEVRPSRDH
jgi:glutamate synthase domain-containing protein 2